MPGGDLYHPKGAAGGVGTGGGIALSASNKLYTSGTVVISGSTNITVLTNGQTILLSGNDPAAAAGVSAIQASNTTFTSGKVILTGVGGGVTVSSNTGQRVDISVAAPVAQTAETAISGVSASDTLYTSGTVRFTGVGGGITVSSNTGQRVDLSVAAPVAQTVQTQNLVDVTLSGNTAGALALISSGTLTLAGGNRVTLSQAGNAVTISGGAETQTAISGIAGSNTTYTSGTVSFTGVGGGVTVSSNTGQRIDISVAAQSVQPGVQHIIASNTTFSSGTVSISGFGDVTVNTAANIIRISAPVQTAQTGLSGVAASNTTYTSGTFTITGVGGGVTVSSNTGQRVDISVAAPVAQTVQTQNVVDVTLSGNTAGAMALVSSGTLTLAGGNNITLSQAGNAVTISGAAAGGAQTAISGVAASNTIYTSGSVTFTGVGGGVTVSSNTGQRIDISVAAPVAQTAQTGISGLANSQTTYTSGTVSMSELGAITIRSTTGNQYQFSVNAQTTQTQNLHNLTISSNTAGVGAAISSGTLTLAGGANITLSQNAGNAITIIGGAGGAETQTAISGIAGSNTTYTSGTVEFTGSNMITVKSSANQRLVIDATQSVQTQSRFNLTLAGNTAGALADVSSGTLSLAGGNNITLSQAGNAVTISGGAGAGGFAGGGISGGNTAGDTGSVTGRLIFAGTPSITLSGSTNAGSQTITISAPQTSSLSASTNITISVDVSTLKFSVADPPTLDYFDNAGGAAFGTGIAALATTAMTFNTMLIQPLNPANELFPARMTVSTAMLQFSISATASSSHSSTVGLGIYTRVNETQLSLLNSVATSWAQAAATNQTASYNGQRWLTIHSSQWSSQPAFHERSQYWFGLFVRSSNASHTGSFMGQFFQNQVQRSGSIMSSIATNTQLAHYPFMGIHSVSQSAFPVSIAHSAINKAHALANFIPNVVFNNITRSF